jgi:ribosomal protein L24E
MKTNQLSKNWEKILLNEKCKTCKKEAKSGIWMSTQFANEKVLLFCSDKCKNKYIKMKLERIKVSYPRYYDKIMKSSREKGF